MTVAQQNEQDIRVRILNSFMSCPHRDTDQIKEVHQQIQAQDPLFYAKLAAWYRAGGGDIRDHNEVFTALLLLDEYAPNREVGLALFRRLPLFMKNKVLGFVRGKNVKLRQKTGKKIRRGKKVVDEVTTVEKTVGLKRSPPTSFRTEIRNYIRWLESDNDRFDLAALRGYKDLKNLYASGCLRIKPSARAQKILFDKEYPKDSKLSVYREISEAAAPKAAKLIVEHKIPYPIAVGLVKKITPSILAALINNMSPQQIINNMASLESRGAMKNAKTKELIQEKLAKAKKSKSVSTLKSKTAKKTGRIKDEEITKQLDEVADAQVKRKGQITLPTAIFVDRSGSMTQAIEIGKAAAALVSGAMKAEFYVVAFDNVPTEIKASGTSYTDWENAFAPIRPGGSTSIGCALEYLRQNKLYVEQIVVITDEGENSHPFFHNVYRDYSAEMKTTPSVVIIRAGGMSSAFSRFLDQNQIPYDRYTPPGNDYYALPGLLSLLSRKSKLDLVMEIMKTPLPKRNGFFAV